MIRTYLNKDTTRAESLGLDDIQVMSLECLTPPRLPWNRKGVTLCPRK